MLRPKHSVVGFVVSLALCILALACSLPTTHVAAKGNLTIQIGNSINALTLVPGISMDATSFSVVGTGPGGAGFTATTTGASVTKTGLAFGMWTVVVNALNAAHELIGSGAASTAVNTGQTSALTVPVRPITGTGTLSLGVSWPADQVQSPAIVAELTPALGLAQDLDFAIAGSSASYSSSTVGNGYYTLSFTLRDNGLVVAGAVEVVRIVAGQTTSGSYTFTKVNAPGGAIEVNIDADLRNPLDVAIAGASPTMNAGGGQTLSASVSNYVGNLSYVWYVNGQSAATGPSFTFGQGIAAGFYRIDLTAFTADGTRAGSGTADVVVVVQQAQPSLYAAGSIRKPELTYGIPACWVNGDCRVLTTDAASPWVTSLAVSGSDIYVGGGYGVNNVGLPCYWRNGDFHKLPFLPYVGDVGSQVTSIAISGQDVYIAGEVMDSNSYFRPCYWKNETLVLLPGVPPQGGGVVSCMIIDGQDVIAAGNYSSSEGYHQGYWRNGVWTDLLLPGGVTGAVKAAAQADSHLYFAGLYYESSSAHAGYWRDDLWVELPLPSGANGCAVNAIAAAADGILIAGVIHQSDGTDLPCYWHNGSFIALPSPVSAQQWYVTSIASFGQDIYAGGYYYVAQPLQVVAGVWKNGQWSALPTPLGFVYSGISALVVR